MAITSVQQKILSSIFLKFIKKSSNSGKKIILYVKGKPSRGGLGG
jgi:hypothetical protein